MRPHLPEDEPAPTRTLPTSRDLEDAPRPIPVRTAPGGSERVRSAQPRSTQPRSTRPGSGEARSGQPRSGQPRSIDPHAERAGAARTDTRAPCTGTPAGRPVTQQGTLRITPRGRRVLALGALGTLTVLVLLVVGVVRLIAGPDEATAPPAAAAPEAPVCEPTATQSQNCWPVIDAGDDPLLSPSPWITGRILAGDVQTVLDHVAARFDATVEPVDPDSSWGWANRSVRGEGDDQISNHASGTSIDLNAVEHPLGESGTYTDAQVEAIHAILAEVSPVVSWGGDFDGRKDEMHFEIVGDAAAVAEVAARLRAAGG